MKKIKYISIIILLVVINSCKKEFPALDTACYGCLTNLYTNKYILTDIYSSNLKKDTIWIDSHYYTIEIGKVKDTTKYNDFFINIDLLGNLVVENNYYTSLSNNNSLLEQKYFLNKIKEFNIYSNTHYNQSENLKINCIDICFRDKNRKIHVNNNYLGNEIGYTPIEIRFTQAPDTSKWISFNIEVIDDKDNVFTSQTDSIYIIK